MSDPSQASDVEPTGDADADRDTDARRDTGVDTGPADRTDRTADAEAEAAANAEDDAEDVESEWHVWILAAIVVAGIALFFAPRFFLPELLGSLGVFLVVIGLLGWVVKWAIERTA